MILFGAKHMMWDGISMSAYPDPPPPIWKNVFLWLPRRSTFTARWVWGKAAVLQCGCMDRCPLHRYATRPEVIAQMLKGED